MHEYKKLNVWLESIEFVTAIYSVTKKFPAEDRFCLISQINRSAVSISSNIAEGAGRNSDGEFIQFPGIAVGSSYELETQLMIARNLGYISDIDWAPLSDKLDKIQKMIFKLQKSLKK